MVPKLRTCLGDWKDGAWRILRCSCQGPCRTLEFLANRVPPMDAESFLGTVPANAEREEVGTDDETPEQVAAQERLGKLSISAQVDVILQRAQEPWVSLTLGGKEIAPLRLGALVVVMGPTGSGKTTLAAGLLAEHAELNGPSLYQSLELDSDELAARLIGMRTDAAWLDVLRGGVPREKMIGAVRPLKRLYVIDHTGDPSIEGVDRRVQDLRLVYGNQPIMVACDYLQLASAIGGDPRTAIATAVEGLRTTAKRLRVVVIGVSQTSRAAAERLRTGDMLGAETASAGAETSAIERSAYLTLALGVAGELDDSGVNDVELNIGKSRFGGGDRIIPMRFDGRSGLWTVTGEARSAGEVRAERQDEKGAAKIRKAADLIVGAASRADSPVTRDQLRAAAKVSRKVNADAIELALKEGALVETTICAPRTKSRMLWTPARWEAHCKGGMP